MSQTRKSAIPETGPRGGRTTVTKSGMVRKAVYLHHEEWEQLRRQAFEENRPTSEIFRDALRAYLAAARASERKRRRA